MERKTNPSPDRLAFFDNLRYLMVLLVLIFHSGASYGSIAAFWPYHDPNPTEFVDIIMMLLDVFMMSILFFIAGYFALPSQQKRGGRGFLKAKLRRLGLPWLVVTILVLPILDYVHYYTQSASRGLSPRSYGMHWWVSMKRIAGFYIGPLRMSEYLDMTEHFYQRYMWFVSLLLLFFVVFWLLCEARAKWSRVSRRSAQDSTSSSSSVLVALAVVGGISIVLFALVKLLSSSLSNPLDMV